MTPSRLLLASGSPRRRELLTRTGLSFETARPDIDETPLPDELPDTYVARLSLEKSLAVGDFDGVILTADTTVSDDGAILGKPADVDEATAMLRRLRGRAHTVYTGITLRLPTTHETQTLVMASSVLMRDYSDTEIAQYVASGDPFDKAGSYAVQHAEFHPVAQITGCYANVMGLPLCTVCTLLGDHGMTIPVPVACDPANSRCVVKSSA